MYNKNATKASFFLIILLSIVLILGQGARAEYPDSQITIIVPFDPGGGSDAVARAFSKQASDILGVEFVFDYQPGAGGAIGTREVRHRRPDGYTIATFNTPHIAIQPAVGVADYDPMEDFDYLGQVGADGMVIAVHKDTPFDTLEEAIELAKEEPGTINLGLSARFATSGLVALTVQEEADFSFNEVQFESGAETSANLIGRHIDIAVGGYAPFEGAGDEIKVLAVSSEERHPELPEVPTLKESGIDLSISAGRIFFAPAGLDSEVKEKLVSTVKEVYNTPEFQEDLLASGINPSYRSPSELVEYIRELDGLTQRLVELYEMED